MVIGVYFTFYLLLHKEGSFPRLFTIYIIWLCHVILILWLILDFRCVFLRILNCSFFVVNLRNVSMKTCIYLFKWYNFKIRVIKKLFNIPLSHLYFLYLVESFEFFHRITQVLNDLTLIFIKNGDDKMDTGQQWHLHCLFNQTLFSFV